MFTYGSCKLISAGIYVLFDVTGFCEKYKRQMLENAETLYCTQVKFI